MWYAIFLFLKKEKLEGPFKEKLISFEKHVFYFTSLTLFGYLGSLVRLFVKIFIFGNHESTFYYVNIIGCFFIGTIYQIKSNSNSHIKYHAHLLTCLSTGFCGCLTSFSSWQLECTNQFLSGNYMNLIDLQVLGIASFLASFIAGTHFAPLFLSIDFLFEDKTWTENVFIRRLTNLLFVVFWIFASTLFLTTISSFIKHTLLTLFFCTLGCNIRYYLGLYNPISIAKLHIPLFTLLVNVLGCILISTSVSIQKHFTIQDDIFHIMLLGMNDGLFGSLTTVSTFVLELYFTIPAVEMKYMYYTLSVGISMPLMITIQLLFAETHFRK